MGVFGRQMVALGGVLGVLFLMTGCPGPGTPVVRESPVVKNLGNLQENSLTLATADTLSQLSFSLPSSSEALIFFVNPTSQAFSRSWMDPASESPGKEAVFQKIRRLNSRVWGNLPRQPAASPARALDGPAPLVVDVSRLEYKSASISDPSQGFGTVPMTLRESSGEVGVDGGETRSLHLWVADDCWGPDSQKAYPLNRDMLEALEKKFLASGPDNDVYDWTTGLVGKEWGSSAAEKYGNLIGFDGRIHIFIYDLEGDNSLSGGLMGYYYSGNNVADKKYLSPGEDTNKMIGFALDALALANPDSGDGDKVWSLEDYWPKEAISTLAHELQHAIMFYQKGILFGTDFPETWLNEMCSLVVEDFLADKLDMEGPRGVPGKDYTSGSGNNTLGRLPLYNGFPEASLIDWGTQEAAVDKSYSTAYAFGAYLARTYGPGLFRSLVQSKNRTLEDLVSRLRTDPLYGRSGLTVPGLLAEWTAAVHLSDRVDAPPGLRLNIGAAFQFDLEGRPYRLGSIDHHKYLYRFKKGPGKWSSSQWNSAPSYAPGSVTVLSLGGQNSSLTSTISLSKGMEAWVLIK